MNRVMKIEILVSAQTALALQDSHRLQAVGHLIDQVVDPDGRGSLAELFRTMAEEMSALGSDPTIVGAENLAELEAYNAERRG